MRVQAASRYQVLPGQQRPPARTNPTLGALEFQDLHNAGLPSLPAGPRDQQPKHWSGVLCATIELVRAVGKPGVKMPPPWRVIPGLPLRAFPVTLLFRSVSGDVGPPKRTPFQMPAPCAEPFWPLAIPRLPLTAAFVSISGPLLVIPAP